MHLLNRIVGGKLYFFKVGGGWCPFNVMNYNFKSVSKSMNTFSKITERFFEHFFVLILAFNKDRMKEGT
jgi:hypothetical protein